MSELVAMESRLSRLEESQKEIRLVLGGDLTGKIGILQNQAKMISALFDEKEGLVPRLTQMERRELARISWIKGAHWVSGVAGGIIGTVVTILSHLVKW
jgi:hypothetical protein